MQHSTGRVLPFLLGAASILTAAAAFLLFRIGAESAPVLFCEPSDPASVVEAFFDNVCRGDYASASSFCQGGLPEEAAPTEGDAAALYTVLSTGRSWEFSGESLVRGTQAYCEVSFTYPDADRLTADLKEAVQAGLAQRVELAARDADVYTEDGEYREDVVVAVWDEILAQRLALVPEYTVTSPLSISLVLEGHDWKICCSDELLRALRGGI